MADKLYEQLRAYLPMLEPFSMSITRIQYQWEVAACREVYMTNVQSNTFTVVVLFTSKLSLVPISLPVKVRLHTHAIFSHIAFSLIKHKKKHLKMYKEVGITC